MTVIDNDLSLQRNRLPWNGFLVVDMSWDVSTWPPDSLERGVASHFLEPGRVRADGAVSRVVPVRSPVWAVPTCDTELFLASSSNGCRVPATVWSPRRSVTEESDASYIRRLRVSGPRGARCRRTRGCVQVRVPG